MFNFADKFHAAMLDRTTRKFLQSAACGEAVYHIMSAGLERAEGLLLVRGCFSR
jgi:hypothetical protein